MYGRSVAMNDTKLTVRVSRELLDNAKHFAAQHHTTLTELFEAYLRSIPANHPLENAPIVRRLSGILPPEINTGDYKKHLEKKYGQ
jgi:hypothetical protein